MTKQIKIICDCDNVLLDFTKGFVKWHNDVYSDIKLSSDPSAYDFGITGDIEPGFYDRIDEFSRNGGLRSLECMEPGIVEKFKIMSSKYRVSVHSAANPKYIEDRIFNLGKFDIAKSDLVLCPDKIAKIIELAPDVCIEDSPSNIQQLADAGISVLYPLYVKYTSPINHPLAIGYNSWDDVLSILTEFEPLV